MVGKMFERIQIFFGPKFSKSKNRSNKIGFRIRLVYGDCKFKNRNLISRKQSIDTQNYHHLLIKK